jgi:hypothetical protein
MKKRELRGLFKSQIFGFLVFLPCTWAFLIAGLHEWYNQFFGLPHGSDDFWDRLPRIFIASYPWFVGLGLLNGWLWLRDKRRERATESGKEVRQGENLPPTPGAGPTNPPPPASE